MGRPEENQLPQSLNQTAFQPPNQGYPVPQPDQIPFQPTAPQGYPNQHDNPLSLPLPQQEDSYMSDKNVNPQSTPSYTPQPFIEQPPPSHTYPPQQPPLPTYPAQQPHVAYAPQAQPKVGCYPPQQSVVAAGTSYINPQSYMNYTPNHNPQPQVVNYVIQPQPTTGTPNPYQPPVPVTSQEWSTGLLDCFYDPENGDFFSLFFFLLEFN